MSKLKTNDLSSGYSSGLRKDLVNNFTIIDKFITESSNIGKETSKTTRKKLEEFEKKIEDEIRAIVLPEDDSGQPGDYGATTKRLNNFLIDSHGVKHATMGERLMAEFEIFEEGNSKKEHLGKYPINITEAGLISVDYVAISKLKQTRKLGIVGDSVAHGTHSVLNFGQILQEKIGCDVQNLSVSGAKMSNVADTAIVNQANQLYGCDVAIIQGTDDDWLHDLPLGNSSDTTDQTYLGALKLTIKHIKSNNPSVKILVMTATRQTPMKNGRISRTDRTKNKLGLTLHDYMNAEKEALDTWNVPYADFMTADGGFDPTNPAFKKAMMSEGLHPNATGHQYITQKLAQSFYWFYG